MLDPLHNFISGFCLEALLLLRPPTPPPPLEERFIKMVFFLTRRSWSEVSLYLIYALWGGSFVHYCSLIRGSSCIAFSCLQGNFRARTLVSVSYFRWTGPLFLILRKAGPSSLVSRKAYPATFTALLESLSALEMLSLEVLPSLWIVDSIPQLTHSSLWPNVSSSFVSSRKSRCLTAISPSS